MATIGTLKQQEIVEVRGINRSPLTHCSYNLDSSAWHLLGSEREFGSLNVRWETKSLLDWTIGYLSGACKENAETGRKAR